MICVLLGRIAAGPIRHATSLAFFRSDGTRRSRRSRLTSILITLGHVQVIFGMNSSSVYANIAEADDIYGARSATPWLHNVFFANGMVDPWQHPGASYLVTEPEAAVRGVLGRLMNTTAHCADMYEPTPRDPAELTLTRTLQVQSITSWLANRQWA